MSVHVEARPIDLAHLCRYTGGDAKLNAEILELFRTQSRELIAHLELHLRASEVKDWRETAHALKGGARGIGAFDLADAAAAAEFIDISTEPERAASALQHLRASAEAVNLFLGFYLGS